MQLPRVLVLCGLALYSSHERKRFCDTFALADVTEGEFKGEPGEYLAEVVFAPVKVRRGGVIENDLNSALQTVAKGWEGTPERAWALVLLQLSYEGRVEDPEYEHPDSVDETFCQQIMEKLAEKWPERHPGRTAIPIVATEEFWGLRLPERRKLELAVALSNLGVQDYLEYELGLLYWDLPPHLQPPVKASEAAKVRSKFADFLFRYGLLEGSELPTVDTSGCVQWVAERVPIIGKSRALVYALREARVAAKMDRPCLLLGPSGSGKELFARYIHEHSARAQKQNMYLPYNCAGVEDSLLVSELFGHVKGAFTDAIRDRAGVFQQADKGTLFLDEIGDMSPRAQAMVLRTLPSGEIQPSGEKKKQVDVRVIAATNKDLEAMVRKGEFRKDLLDRLSGFVVHIPPLKDRIEDIPLLFDFFVKRTIEELEEPCVSRKGIDGGVYEVLRRRRWDGNVWELENLARIVTTRRKDSWYIGPNDIPPERSSSPQETGTQLAPHPRTPARLEDALERLALEEVGELQGALAKIQAAYGQVLERVLSKALDAKRDHMSKNPHPIYGDLVPTSALKLLLNDPNLTAAEAKREFHRLGKMLPEAPRRDSALGKVLRWAAGGEKTERARSKKEKHGDAHKRHGHVQKR